jgi:hypothetical protein
MLLKEIFSKIKIIIRKPFIKKKVSSKKKAEEEVLKKSRRILHVIWQFIAKRVIKSKSKAKGKSKSKKGLSKKFQNKRNKKSESKDIEDKSTSSQEDEQHKRSNSIDGGIERIGKMLQSYEEFLKKDFQMVLDEVQSAMRQLRSSIIGLAFSEDSAGKLATELQEIRDVYSQSGAMLGNTITSCEKYQQIILDVKRQGNPQQSLNRVQSQLDKMMSSLQKGQRMADIESNKDFLYVNRYLKEKHGYGISM